MIHSSELQRQILDAKFSWREYYCAITIDDFLNDKHNVVPTRNIFAGLRTYGKAVVEFQNSLRYETRKGIVHLEDISASIDIKASKDQIKELDDLGSAPISKVAILYKPNSNSIPSLLSFGQQRNSAKGSLKPQSLVFTTTYLR